MANGTYIGTVVVDEIGYKYTLVPATVENMDNQTKLSEEKGEVDLTEKVFLTEKDLLAELPAPLNNIPYINPAIFPCTVVIEEDEEHGKEEVTIDNTTDTDAVDQPNDQDET